MTIKIITSIMSYTINNINNSIHNFNNKMLGIY
jgi:hypothetical protein